MIQKSTLNYYAIEEVLDELDVSSADQVVAWIREHYAVNTIIVNDRTIMNGRMLLTALSDYAQQHGT